jgi:hypothetical protein
LFFAKDAASRHGGFPTILKNLKAENSFAVSLARQNGEMNFIPEKNIGIGEEANILIATIF